MSRREKSLKSTKINADLKKIQHRRPKFRGLAQGGRLTNPSAWPKQAATVEDECMAGPSQEPDQPHHCSSSPMSPTQQDVDQSQSFDASYIQLDDLHEDQTKTYFFILVQNHGIHLLHCNMFLVQDWNPETTLLIRKYVNVRRVSRMLSDTETWLWKCSCCPHMEDFIESLSWNLDMSSEEYNEKYACCHHVAVTKMYAEHYDSVHDIEPEEGYMTEQYPEEPIFQELDNNRVCVFDPKHKSMGVVVPFRDTFECLCCRQPCTHIDLVRDTSHEAAISTTGKVLSYIPGQEKRIKTSATSSHSISLQIPERHQIIFRNGICNVLASDKEENLLLYPEACQVCGEEPGRNIVQCDLLPLYDVTKVISTKVFSVECEKCGTLCSYDGCEDAVLNMGSYLVAHQSLRSYFNTFKHGNSPLNTFYNIWCDNLMMSGFEDIQKDFAYTKFLYSWYNFLDLLQIDYGSGFMCPLCGKVPDTIIMDGTSVAFRKRLLDWETLQHFNRELYKSNKGGHSQTGTRFHNRIFIDDPPIRKKLSKLARGLIQKSDFEELQQQLDIITEPDGPNVNQILSAIVTRSDSEDVQLPVPFRGFVRSLASGSPVSALILPSESNRLLVEQVLSTENVGSSPAVMEQLQLEMPVIFKFISNFPSDMKPQVDQLLRDLQQWAFMPYILQQESTAENPMSLQSPLSYFPQLPTQRARGFFKCDRHNTTRHHGKQCSKTARGHPSLLPGVFTLFCQHGICYGFEVMPVHESPNTPFTVIKTRFPRAPSVIIYDNACNLHSYCMNRDPIFFMHTRFLVDRLHWRNHHACSEGYNSNLYPQYEQINTQANEQANAGIKRLKGFISYMNQDNFMDHLTLYLWQRNQEKSKNLVECDL